MFQLTVFTKTGAVIEQRFATEEDAHFQNFYLFESVEVLAWKITKVAC